MAQIKKGILGGFSGTVGTVVGSNWRGMDIIRSLPKPSGKAPTERQLEVQLKFKAAIQFLLPLRGLQSQYYGTGSGTKSRNNLATSYVIKEAIMMTDGLPQLTFSKVQITKGELAALQDATVSAVAGNSLSFSWSDNSAQAKAQATDVLATAVYCESLQDFALMDGPATRAEGVASQLLPMAFAGKEVHVYAFLHDAAGSTASNSVYLGTVEVLP